MSNDLHKKTVHAREHAEPAERNSPVPWLLGVVAASLCIWGVSYFLLDQGAEPVAASPAKIASITPQAAKSQAAAPVAALVRPGGTLVLAGLLEDEAHEVTRANDACFHMRPWAERAGWVVLSGRRREHC